MRHMVATTEERMGSFCDSFGRFGAITKAAAVAGISRETVRLWHNEDRNGFRQQMRDAQATYAEYLESMALDRVENPQGNRGSDTLLIALNNANNPDKWRGNQVSVDVDDAVVKVLAQLQALDAATAKALPEGKVVEVEGDELPWE